MRCAGIAAVLLMLFSPCLAADAFKPSLEGKKLISYGADWPNTGYVRAHVRDMEKHPFDGIVIGITESAEPQLNAGTLGTKAWGKQKFDAKDFQHCIDDLRATKFETFTDNFIQVEAMPGDVNWFDDQQWDAVVANFRILARVAKKGGCVGLELDPEQYGSEWVFTPLAWTEAKRNGHNEQQYIAQARVRGQQLMRAINEEFPGIRILCLFGPALTSIYAKEPKHDYALLAPFLEGMCEAADHKSEIIDGYEQSYGYRVPVAFQSGREAILKARDTFEDKSAFDRVMRVGFGLWTDNDSGHRGWFPEQPEKNHFQPATWQNAVHYGLSYSDRYVWVWRERIHEWEGKGVSQAYEDAQRAARAGPAHVEATQKSAAVSGGKKQANGEDRSWESTLGEALETNRVLVDLTTPGWTFRTDPDDRAVADKWFTADTKSPPWSPIDIGKFWEEQGWDYDGVAWYRRTITLAEEPKDKVQAIFGAVDESADVYLNGERAGGHDVGEIGWDEKFSVDLTGKLHAGKNELAVRVIDRTGPGGIWKPAALFAAAPDTTAGKKLIEYGWDCPDTAYVREHIREMEQRPFNGVVIRPTFPATQPGQRAPSMGRTVFQRAEFRPEQYQHCIDDLKATRFEKFTDNFIQVLSQPADCDWFDSDTDSWITNAAVMGKIARAGNCVGLMFDPEQYGPHKLWTYSQLPEFARAAHTLEQYRDHVRMMGDHFIRAINGELPSAKILCLFGPALTYGQERGGNGDYSLLAAFIEGMCRGADAGTKIIDGCEQSYMYRTRTSFRAGRRDVLLARATFKDPSLFDRKMQVGFGLWLDNDSGKRPWDRRNYLNNYFQPETWQNAIHFGLSASDEYVWVYSQALDWWTGGNVVPQYVAAQRDGRERYVERMFGAAPPVPARFIRHAPPLHSSATRTGKVILDLGDSPWSFHLDPAGVGAAQHWYGPHVDTQRWSRILIGHFWEEAGFDYDGYAWYRIKFRLPDRPQKVALNIGAADESATVWLNGREVGTHDIGEYGWDKPFSFDVTPYLAPGDDENALAIRVLDRAGPGGLWNTVTLSAGQ